jgi:hypothetical protein
MNVSPVNNNMKNKGIEIRRHSVHESLPYAGREEYSASSGGFGQSSRGKFPKRYVFHLLANVIQPSKLGCSAIQLQCCHLEANHPD